MCAESPDACFERASRLRRCNRIKSYPCQLGALGVQFAAVSPPRSPHESPGLPPVVTLIET